MIRRPSARLAALVLIVAMAGLVGGACRRSKAVRPAPTSMPSTAPPGTGLAGVPGIDDAGTTGTTGPGGCLGVPGEAQAPPAIAADLPPLPDGTRWLSTSVPQQGQTLVVAASPSTLPGFQDRIRTVWRPGGWRELAGEAEPGREVEGVFQKADIRLGMRARLLYCDKDWLEVRIVVNR